MINKTYLEKIMGKIRANADGIAGYIASGRTEEQAKKHFRHEITKSPDSEKECEKLFRARMFKHDWPIIVDNVNNYMMAIKVHYFAREYYRIAYKLLDGEITDEQADELVNNVEYRPTFMDMDHAARLSVYGSAWDTVMSQGKQIGHSDALWEILEEFNDEELSNSEQDEDNDNE